MFDCSVTFWKCWDPRAHKRDQNVKKTERNCNPNPSASNFRDDCIIEYSAIVMLPKNQDSNRDFCKIENYLISNCM